MRREPVPTGRRGRIPTVATRGVRDRDTRTEEDARLRASELGTTNLYELFRLTDFDLLGHVKLNLPDFGRKTSNDVSTGGAEVPEHLRRVYPPQIPPELAWMTVCSCVRSDVHPEVVSEPELIAHCIELGIPAHYASRAYPGRIGETIRRSTSPMPADAPSVPGMKTPRDRMFARLAVLELTGGFAYALDPNFARRTLAVGPESYPAVLECSRSPHALLAQNAVALLANYAHPETGAELRKIFQKHPDPVCRLRALGGLLRRRDRSAVPELLSAARGSDPIFRSVAIYALGVLEEPGAADAIRRILASGAGDPDVLWSALPAAARIADGSAEAGRILRLLEKLLREKCGGDDEVHRSVDRDRRANTPTAEAPGTKVRVLRQMALLALAAQGDSGAREELHRRLEKSGHTSFHGTVWYLLCDVLGKLGDRGGIRLAAIVESDAPESVRMHGLRVLLRCGGAGVDRLERLLADASPVVRAAALRFLAERDGPRCAERCREILESYAEARNAASGSEAFLVAIAAEILGSLDAWKGKAAECLVGAARQALAQEAHARRLERVGKDARDYQIAIHPPLVETLLLECGRAGTPAARDLLLAALDDRPRPHGRAEAALALGAIGGARAVEALLKALEDPDGWVRHAAYVSLKAISGQDWFVDWIFSSVEECRKQGRRYRDWFAAHPPK
jgi:HEAT repeat protein